MPQPAQAKPLFSAQPAQAAQKKSQIYPRVGYRLQLSFNKKSCALKKMVHFPAQPAGTQLGLRPSQLIAQSLGSRLEASRLLTNRVFEFFAPK